MHVSRLFRNFAPDFPNYDDMNNEETKKKGSWGGAREGAGRKGRGGKHVSFRAPKEFTDVIDVQENKSEFIKQCFEIGLAQKQMRDSLPDYSENVVELKPIKIGVYEVKAAAGSPLPVGDVVFEQGDLTDYLCNHADACYLVTIEGDSMIYVGIHPGDKVVVDPSHKEPTKEDIALCQLNGELAIKFVEKHGDEIWMVSANPKYDPIVVTEKDSFDILGIVSNAVRTRPKRSDMNTYL